MTPQEKAKELVNKCMQIGDFESAKQAAIIAVDEIVKALKIMVMIIGRLNTGMMSNKKLKRYNV